jgi:uncharacterized membrane protein YvbJ
MNLRMGKVTCTKCGLENYSDAPFCIKCGKNLISETKPKTSAIAIYLFTAALAAIQFIEEVSDDGVSSLWSLVYLVAFFGAMWMVMKRFSNTGEIMVTDQEYKSEISGTQKF